MKVFQSRFVTSIRSRNQWDHILTYTLPPTLKDWSRNPSHINLYGRFNCFLIGNRNFKMQINLTNILSKWKKSVSKHTTNCIWLAPNSKYMNRKQKQTFDIVVYQYIWQKFHYIQRHNLNQMQRWKIVRFCNRVKWSKHWRTNKQTYKHNDIK